MQQRLFYDDWQQAVTDTIANSGKSVKEVASALWPDMKMDSAYARFKNALRDDKAEKLTFAEVIYICRFCGSSDALYYMAQELDHAKPEPIVPQDEQARLLREFNASADALKKLADRIERFSNK